MGAIRQQLQDFVGEFAEELGRSERRYWCGKYLEGLLREGERKSIEPLAARVGGDEQALQQFVNQSPWDHADVLFRLRALMRRRAGAGGVLVLDDTSLPKQGRHSVGVARQDCGALGKIANCQSLVTWHWTGAGLHWPLAAQLYLPLGFDHFEGRSWRGLHHHLALCFLACCFLTRLRTSKKTPLAACSATLAHGRPRPLHLPTRPNPIYPLRHPPRHLVAIT